MSIGEFSRRSRLSPKALRLYDEIGLLAPSRVERHSGYRYYTAPQLERARLVAALRRLDVPLADVARLVDLDRAAAAEALGALGRELDATHAARRRLVDALIDDLHRRRGNMKEVDVREVPERHLLCLKRHVDPAGAWDLGKEFIAVVRDAGLPRLEGPAGETFAIFWGEVSQDSDGPVEWCRPVPADEADALAARVPGLSARVEPAHREAYVAMGNYADLGDEDWPLAERALRRWAEERGLSDEGLSTTPDDLGVRITYHFAEEGPDLDFAVPID